MKLYKSDFPQKQITNEKANEKCVRVQFLAACFPIFRNYPFCKVYFLFVPLIFQLSKKPNKMYSNQWIKDFQMFLVRLNTHLTNMKIGQNMKFYQDKVLKWYFAWMINKIEFVQANKVQKILLFKSMNHKQLHLQPGDASPSGLIEQDQPSQMSLNPSFVQRSQPNKTGQIQSPGNNEKKRLKFDKIFDDDIIQQNNNNAEMSSEQSVEVEFHLANYMKNFSDFFKSDGFRYLYVAVLALFLINCTLEAAEISHGVVSITEKIDLAFQIFFSICIMIKFTQYESQNFFWLIIDILTNISAYLAFGLSSQPEAVRYFKAAKILRLLLIVKESKFLRVPAAKLINSLSSAGKILFPAVLFIYFYAVVGLYSFRDYEYSKCRDPENKLLTQNWTVYTDAIFLCGQKHCPVVGGVQYECLNPIDFGVQPNPYQVKNIYQGYGLMRYNNIFYALFSTFKQTFITGSSRLMILGKQVTNYFYVLIYYLSFIYLLAYIYLNIFYGLMITNEELTDDNRRQSSFELRLQKRRSSKRKGTHNPDQDNAERNDTFHNGEQSQKPLMNSGEKSTKSITGKSKLQKAKSFGLKKAMSTKPQIINEEQKSKDKQEFEQVINFHNDDSNLQQPSNNPNSKNLKLKPKFSEIGHQNEEGIKGILSNKRDLAICNQIQAGEQDISNGQSIQSQESQEIYLRYGQIMDKYFIINHIIVILCSVNMLTDYEGQTYNVKLVVDGIDFAFFWAYMFQMIFRIVVHMKYIPKQPFDKAFKMDLILFCCCTGGLLYEVATAQNLEHFLMASDSVSRLLRTLKYLRIFILISSTPYFTFARIIFNSTLEAVHSVRHFSGLWLLILVTFSIMGYHMFHGKTKVDHEGHLDMENGHPQHIGFEGILDSVIYTVFIFFNEEWDWLVFEQYVNQQAFLVVWQLLVLVIGLQVLSKYFMALLMKQLGDKLNEEEQLAEQNECGFLEDESEFEKIGSLIVGNVNRIMPEKKQLSPPAITFKLKPKQSMKEPELVKKSSSHHDKRISINAANGLVEVKNFQLHPDVKKQREKHESYMRDIILRDNSIEKKNHSSGNKQKKPQKDIVLEIDQTDEVSVQSVSCFEKPKLRVLFFLKCKLFIVLKIIMILISIICTMAMNPHEDPNSSYIQNFTKIWYATMGFFCLEIFLSIFAFGLTNEKTGYLRNVMSWINIVVFAIQILAIIPGLTQNAHLQSLLSFRILRIFYFVELKYEADADMRLTMFAFWKLLPKVANLLAITIIMYGFFAILLVKIYKDDYYYCDGYQDEKTILTDLDCMNWGGSWVKRKMNVSNIFNSLLYLFLLATTEGWSTQVIQSASLAGKGHEPEYGHSLWMEYFFSVFFFFGNMIMLNVFIGLSVYNFQKIKSEVTGLARLSKDNKMWFSIKNTIHRLSPKMKDSPPDNCFSYFIHLFINSKAYKIICTIMMIMFMVTMSLYTTNMSDSKQKILDVVLDIYIVIFLIEYVMLWVGYGLRAVKRRIFIFSTLGTLYLVILLFVSNFMALQPKTHRIMYGIAVCVLSIRCFALMNDIDFVRKMINSLVSIFPQTSNIWLLIFVTLVSYGVIGVYFFGYLKIGPELNEFDQNYTNLPSAIYALIKFSTLESPILQIIESTATIQPNSVCYDLYSYNDFVEHGRMGCGSSVGYIFFLSFHVVYSLILLSTLLAIIVDAYSQVRREEQSMVNKFQLEEVQKEWENFDPEATGYISYRDFWIFTAKLVKIYKVNKEQLLSHETKQSFLKSLQIPIYEDQHGILSFQFHEVVEALTRIVVKQKMGPDWDTKQADKVFKNHNHNQTDAKLFKKSVYDSSHVLTLIILKSGLKTWKRKTANVENHQNLQNLFSIARRQKQKIETNQDIVNQTMKLAETKKRVDIEESTDERKVSQGPKKGKTAPFLNTQPHDQTQSSVQDISINKNIASPQKDEHRNAQLIQKPDRISTTKQTYSKIKSPREPSSIQKNNFVVNNIVQNQNEDLVSDVEEFKCD